MGTLSIAGYLDSKIRFRRRQIQPPATNRTFVMLKCFLIGMCFSAAYTPLVLSQVEPDPFLARDFTYSIVGGVLGALACHSIWGAKEIREMARDALGNMCLAIAFGPTVSYWISEHMSWTVNPRILMAVSSTLGLSGAAVVRGVGPKILSTLSEAIPAAILRAMGGEAKKPPDNNQ